jgi:ribosomal-protein-alanine N-acetyltransferase
LATGIHGGVFSLELLEWRNKMLINNIGTKDIETRRLLLRRFRISDLETIFNNWISDPIVQHNYGEPTYDTIPDTQRLLEKWINSYENRTV